MIKKISSSYIKIFLIFSYIICWLSISTSFDDIILIFKVQNTTISNKLNFIRQFLNILIFPILITIFLSKLKEISFKRNLIFFLSFFYFIFQIPGLFLYDNSYKNLVFIISSLNIIFIFIVAGLHFNKEEYLVFIKITLLMLILVLAMNFKIFIEFFSSERNSIFYLYLDKDFILGKYGPRSTGASRSWLLVFIISNLIFIKFFLKHSKIKISFYIFCATIILLFQSRTVIFLLMLFILLNFYYERKFNKINFFKYFFYYVGYPLLMLVLVLLLKTTFFINTNSQPKPFIENYNPETIIDNYKRPINNKTFSSGRVEDWKSIINLTKTSLIFGFGSQADRYLINQSASNGLLYALSSSGILGLFFYVTLSIYCFWIVVVKLFTNFLKTFNYEDYYCSIIILILLARSVLESSYAVFSIDFIIFYTFINYLYGYSVVNNDGIK